MLDDLNYTTNKVEWSFETAIIEKDLDDIITATENTSNHYVYVETGKNFVAQVGYFFDFSGVLLLSFDLEKGVLNWSTGNSIQNYDFSQVGYFPSKNMTTILVNNGVLIFDSMGNKLFLISSPVDYSLEYFQEFPDYISVVATSIKNADKYGRTQYNLKINVDSKKLENVNLA
ncbi:hypothetical protein Hs30E_05100 [Lactococcus hodotermopsidis]|uniref:Uncharacterized protein n=1 Tax=Pseudolactococcus hodotermopsidis TaxID=2709157 RepID=A0A6A0B960_9LACT|nr:hypothetical protein [Lactococcus hodotermopsidis]GFH41959.1 hypothetical protein Hs30E_05100 [Lactococcus hodotermopsidis]